MQKVSHIATTLSRTPKELIRGLDGFRKICVREPAKLILKDNEPTRVTTDGYVEVSPYRRLDWRTTS